MDSNHLDNAIDKANETLEGLLEGACSWFVTQVNKAKERQAAKQETEEMYKKEE